MSGFENNPVITVQKPPLTPEKDEIIHYYAVNRWDEDHEFDEWARPLVALTVEAERILGVTNAQLECCRSTNVVLEDFRSFLKGWSRWVDRFAV